MAIEKSVYIVNGWDLYQRIKMTTQFQNQSGREGSDIAGLQDGTVPTVRGMEKFLRQERLKSTHRNYRNVYV